MAHRPHPKSSIPKKPTRSSLHPQGAPTFAETLQGLKQGLGNLGLNLVGSLAGMSGNVIGGLMGMKKSAKAGDADAEKAYQEALALLQNSDSTFAADLLKELGEDPGKDKETVH